MHPEKSLYQIKKENMETNTRSEIKNENNYHEWRRL